MDQEPRAQGVRSNIHNRLHGWLDRTFSKVGRTERAGKSHSFTIRRSPIRVEPEVLSSSFPGAKGGSNASACGDPDSFTWAFRAASSVLKRASVSESSPAASPGCDDGSIIHPVLFATDESEPRRASVSESSPAASPGCDGGSITHPVLFATDESESRRAGRRSRRISFHDDSESPLLFESPSDSSPQSVHRGCIKTGAPAPEPASDMSQQCCSSNAPSPTVICGSFGGAGSDREKVKMRHDWRANGGQISEGLERRSMGSELGRSGRSSFRSGGSINSYRTGTSGALSNSTTRTVTESATLGIQTYTSHHADMLAHSTYFMSACLPTAPNTYKPCMPSSAAARS